METLIVIVALILGVIVGWFIKARDAKSLAAQLDAEKRHSADMISKEKESADALLAQANARIEEEHALSERMRQESDKQWALKLDAEKKHSAEMVAKEKERADALLAQANVRIEEEHALSERMRQESDKQWALKLDAMKKELLQTAAEQLTKSGEELKRTNDSNITDLLKPIREQFESFKKAVDDSRTQNELSKKTIEDKFAETLKMFQLQQENAIRQLMSETAKIGNDAVNLAKALKSNTKRQGNWGEMVLKTMLENSGLEEGVHFFVQYNVKDDEGKRNIPDVVIKFPEGRSVIVDSKVSLKAYTEYFDTDDEDRQNMLLKSHLASVEKHVDELSEKNYPRVVENSMDYVLMFIPNESSYVAAIKMNPNLLREAYAKKVIVISPNNLVMALQLAYNLWQTDKQVKNIRNIVERGSALYDKVCNFQSSFQSIGEMILKLQVTYNKADAQLSTGPGNVLRQCEMLREYGIVSPTQKKRLKLKEEE